jgi:hypothetical protein
VKEEDLNFLKIIYKNHGGCNHLFKCIKRKSYNHCIIFKNKNSCENRTNYSISKIFLKLEYIMRILNDKK